MRSLPTMAPSPIVPGPPMQTQILEGSPLATASNIDTAVLIARPTQFGLLSPCFLPHESGCKSSRNVFKVNATSPTGIMNLG